MTNSKSKATNTNNAIPSQVVNVLRRRLKNMRDDWNMSRAYRSRVEDEALRKNAETNKRLGLVLGSINDEYQSGMNVIVRKLTRELANKFRPGCPMTKPFALCKRAGEFEFASGVDQVLNNELVEAAYKERDALRNKLIKKYDITFDTGCSNQTWKEEIAKLETELDALVIKSAMADKAETMGAIEAFMAKLDKLAQ